ncbi:MAG TPA: GTP-binding protein [Prolixibacteraceae bacterium]|nr:MAG: GTP-binding protein [Bacteroidetes bacterium GWB2_41_8]HCY42558.1 GTP-binding protein [Prolixibacteraceae bacterium]
MQQTKYHCPKCNNTQAEMDQIRTTGRGFSRIFDIQNKKFTVITCTRCKYSEFYKGTPSTLGNIVDFLVG